MSTAIPELPAYPVAELQPTISAALRENRQPVIQAPPGSGKSTLIPLYLLDAPWRQGRAVILLQPRRAAVRALARRLGELAGDAARIGYVTRYERSVPQRPDIIVMTEGIFTRRLLEHPEAEDTAAVILDEFHERSLATDLAYVLARQCRDLFRPDLRLLIMSATLDSERFNREPFTLLSASGTLYPLTIEYHPPQARTPVEIEGARECRRRIEAGEGSILFFLPGEAEIRRALEELRAKGVPADVTLFPLYGRLSPEEQRRALAPTPDDSRKIVLATNLAETSLTIEGISCVIDSGLRRRSRWNPDTGLPRLETVRISTASAQQRAGRAGRLGPGRVVRLWERSERLQDFDLPEIRVGDLTGLFLSLAVWGDTEGRSLPWPDPPEEERRREALRLLRELGALDEKLVPTQKGVWMARMPVSPRLAAMLIEAGGSGTLRRAALIAAILENGDPLRRDARDRFGADLSLRVELMEEALEGGGSKELADGVSRRIGTEARRLERIAEKAAEATAGAELERAGPGRILLAAYPDRLARRSERGRYRLPGGLEAVLLEGEAGFAPEWIVAGALHRRQREGLIFLAAPLSDEELRPWIEEHSSLEERLRLDEKGNLQARRLRSYGKLQISATPISPADLSDPRGACMELIRAEGLSVLPWNRRAAELHSRLNFLRRRLGDPWPDLSESALLDRLEEWLLPFLPPKLRQDTLRTLPMAEALSSLLPWELRSRADELAPERITLPSGSTRRLRYEEERCILSARIQQLFGLSETPRVAGTEVELELLSPAERPVQHTRDIASFWRHTYPEVRRELRGRYPKHYWPEDPLRATPTDRSKRRRDS